MVDAVALYASAMNDLGNVESIPIEPLNCKGGAVWSGGDTFLRYLKGVSTLKVEHPIISINLIQTELYQLYRQPNKTSLLSFSIS